MTARACVWLQVTEKGLRWLKHKGVYFSDVKLDGGGEWKLLLVRQLSYVKGSVSVILFRFPIMVAKWLQPMCVLVKGRQEGGEVRSGHQESKRFPEAPLYPDFCRFQTWPPLATGDAKQVSVRLLGLQ